MKSHYPTYKDVKATTKEEYRRCQQEHAKSFSIQFWAVILYILVKFRGYTHANAIKLFNDVNDLFRLMDGGIMGKDFDTENCIAWCKDTLKLDLDKLIQTECKEK